MGRIKMALRVLLKDPCAFFEVCFGSKDATPYKKRDIELSDRRKAAKRKERVKRGSGRKRRTWNGSWRESAYGTGRLSGDDSELGNPPIHSSIYQSGRKSGGSSAENS